MPRRDEGSILKELKNGKHTGRWHARLRYTDATGKPREKKRTCLTSAQARSMIATLRVEIAGDAIKAETNSRSYRELDQFYRDQYVHAAKFVGGKKISGFRQDTATVERYMDRSLAFFGDTPLAAITYADCRDYKRHIENLDTGRTDADERTVPRSVSDVNHHLKRVRRMLKVAIEQGWLDIDPFTKGSPLIIESFETERARVLTPDEENRIIAQCDNGYRRHLIPLIVFAVETGCRRGEILKLRWSAVNLTARVITIESGNTKTLRSRMVPVTERLRKTLAALRQNSLRPNSLVFPQTDFKRAFNTACRDAKLPEIHFHDLRHTAITRMLEKGIAPPLVMKISGHTQIKTFLRYVNQTETSVAEIADILDRFDTSQKLNIAI